MVKARPVSPHDDHPVRLHGAWAVRGDGAPSILERRDEDFIGALLEELAGADPAALVPAQRPAAQDGGAMRLWQPVHRAFHLALLEAHCDTFGQPRLDPRKIESAGQVIRRVRTLPDGSRQFEGWCASRRQVTGWVALPAEDHPAHWRDPDPARRPPPRYTGDATFDRETFGTGDGMAEETTALFVAPPAVVAATARTLLYGVMPLTAAARAGAPPPGTPPPAEAWAEHLSLLLRPAAAPVSLWPARPASEQPARLDRADLRTTPVSLPDSGILPGATRFVLLVRQLAQEFGLLRPANPDTHARLIATLNRLSVTLVDGSSRPAGDYLVEAARAYLDPEPPQVAPLRPHAWPAVDAGVAEGLLAVLRQTAAETELAVFGAASGGGRYDDPAARYVLRAFIRVRQPDGCPPKLVWSPCSEEFAIAPWYEPGPGGPVTVALPDLSPAFLRRVKPNVAFSVPASLANVLNQDPKKFLDGSAGKGSSLTLDWICGFSIPIITVCAFILLNIFLSLLNLVFFWLPFVKICVPFPRKK